MNKNLKMITAKDKVIAVINSCVTKDHLFVAELFLDLFFNKFGQINIYFDLRDLMKDKKKEILND